MEDHWTHVKDFFWIFLNCAVLTLFGGNLHIIQTNYCQRDEMCRATNCDKTPFIACKSRAFKEQQKTMVLSCTRFCNRR